MKDTYQSNEAPIPNIFQECFAFMENNLRSEFIVEPKDMVEIVRRYQQLEIIAKQKPSPGHKKQLINWNRIFKSDQSDINFYELTVESPKGIEIDAWIDFICAQYRAATGEHITIKVLDTLTRKDTANLFRFQVSPTQVIAESHPLLKKIPDIFSKAQRIEFDRQRAITKLILRNNPKPICLICDNIIVQDGLSKVIKGTLQCWMSLVHDESGIPYSDLNDASLYKISVVFVDVMPDGSALLVAQVAGHYIVPHKNDYSMHQETFKFMMDAHSAELNNVWKVVMGQFLPKHKFKDLYAFYDSFDDQLPGIASVSIEVHPDYRGNRISGLMLGLISEMLENPNFFDYLAPPTDSTLDELEIFSNEYPAFKA